MNKYMIFICLFLFSFSYEMLMAQKAFVAVGGNASGGGGNISYSVGLTFFSTMTSTNGSVAVGVQEAFSQKLVLTSPPGQTDLTCYDNLQPFATSMNELIAIGGSLSGNCIVLDDLTLESETSSNQNSFCPYDDPPTVIRKYTVFDTCGNSGTSQQTFTFNNSSQGPLITNVAPTCYNCSSINPSPEDISYIVNCNLGSTVTITGPQVFTSLNCPGETHTYTYTVEDECGRSTSAQRDFFYGNQGPTITCTPFNLILECSDPNNEKYIATHLSQVTASGGCSFGVNITNNYTGLNFTSCNNSTQVVVFTAEDLCGCKSNCTTTITLQDNTAPILASNYIDGICNEAICGSDVNFWFKEWMNKVEEGLSATDGCMEAELTWSTNPQIPAPNLDCPGSLSETEVTWIASDDCGNISDISYSFYVTPAAGSNDLEIIQFEGVGATAEEPRFSTGSDLIKSNAIEKEKSIGFVEASFALLQNRPNPFSGQTIIGFVLPESTIATLTIYEVTGRELKQITRSYEAGYQEVLLDRNDFNTGVMYYQLTTSTHKATKKMIHK